MSRSLFWGSEEGPSHNFWPVEIKGNKTFEKTAMQIKATAHTASVQLVFHLWLCIRVIIIGYAF